jgi:hypothetical protein
MKRGLVKLQEKNVSAQRKEFITIFANQQLTRKWDLSAPRLKTYC